MQVDRSLLRGLGRLRLVAPSHAAGHRHGDRRSRATGHGLEFADFRPYHPGDDLRRVDWNAWSRLDTVVVRLFHEDRNLRVCLHLDCSGSMGLGTPRKLDVAGSLTAALVGVGLSQRDTVRLGCFGGTVQAQPVVGHGLGALDRMLHALSVVNAGKGAVDLPASILAQCGTRRSDRAFLISDLLTDEASLRDAIRAMAMTARHPVVLHVIAPEERDPEKLAGMVELVDAETGERRLIRVTPTVRAAYREQVRAWQHAVRRLCLRYRVQYVMVPTDTPIDDLFYTTLRRAQVLE